MSHSAQCTVALRSAISHPPGLVIALPTAPCGGATGSKEPEAPGIDGRAGAVRLADTAWKLRMSLWRSHRKVNIAASEIVHLPVLFGSCFALR